MTEANAYQNASIQNADKVRIISLLYDGAINFLNLSKKKHEAGDIAGKGLYLGKTTAIIGELAGCLNIKEGGELAKNLDRLYSYSIVRLVDINVKNDMKAYDDVLRVLNELRSGWKQMETNYRKTTATVTAAMPAAAASQMLAGLRA